MCEISSYLWSQRFVGDTCLCFFGLDVKQGAKIINLGHSYLGQFSEFYVIFCNGKRGLEHSGITYQLNRDGLSLLLMMRDWWNDFWKIID